MEQMEARLIQSSAIGRRATQEAIIGASLGVFQALATILAIRLLLFLTLIGGFALAVSAMNHQTVISVCVLAAYAILVIFPTAAIEYGRKLKAGG
jgi:hypothetical protein